MENEHADILGILRLLVTRYDGMTKKNNSLKPKEQDFDPRFAAG